MAEQEKTQLFISHHSSKLGVALELEKSLAKYDVSCWLAPRDVEPSEAFDMAIKRAIDESAGILLLFCSQSDKSPHVKRELILADSSRKAIIPMRLEELDPDELAYHLANSQWIDWLEQRESTIERVAAKAHQLAGTSMKTMTVDELIAHSGHDDEEPADPPAPPPPPSPPPLAASADPDPVDEEPEEVEEYYEEPAQRRINWALIVALAALVVALFAAVLLWQMGQNEPQPAAEIPVATEEPADAEPAEEEVVESSPPPPAPAQADPEPEPQIRPSFDCRKASTRAEYMICESPELAQLDRTLSGVYRRAMSAAGANAPRLQRQQRAWRTGVRDACADIPCIARSVRERIAILRAIAAGNLDVPRDRPRPGFSDELGGRTEEDRAISDSDGLY